MKRPTVRLRRLSFKTAKDARIYNDFCETLLSTRMCSRLQRLACKTVNDAIIGDADDGNGLLVPMKRLYNGLCGTGLPKRVSVLLQRLSFETVDAAIVCDDDDGGLLVPMKRQPKRGDWNWIPKRKVHQRRIRIKPMKIDIVNSSLFDLSTICIKNGLKSISFF